MSSRPLLDAVITTPFTGSARALHRAAATFQAVGFTTAGAGTATVVVEASNDDGATWVTLGTISLILSTTPATDGFASAASWKAARGRVTALTGTGASVSLHKGE